MTAKKIQMEENGRKKIQMEENDRKEDSDGAK
jgi:hypothetical protein